MTKIMRAMPAMLSLAVLFTVTGMASASNVAPEPEMKATPHQELMAFLMRGPADPSRLAGKRVAMIVVNGGDAVTLQLAQDYLVEQGATVDVLTPRGLDGAASRHIKDASVARGRARLRRQRKTHRYDRVLG